jgi:hypothetical protein
MIRRLLVLGALWEVLSPGAPAPLRAAEQELTPAEETIRLSLIDEAKTAHAQADHTKALSAAQKALNLKRTPSLELFIAHEARETGALAMAYDMSRLCLVAANQDKTLHDRAKIIKECEEIGTAVKDKIGHLVVDVRDPPEGLRVKISDDDVSIAALGNPYVVNPGPIVVEATAPGFDSFRTEVTVPAGGTRDVSVSLARKEPSNRLPSETPPADAPAATSIDLEGSWTGTFQCPAGITRSEDVRITQQGRRLIARKVTGDDCVPAGVVTWEGVLPKDVIGSNDFPLTLQVRVTVGQPRARRSLIGGTLTISDPNRLVVTAGAEIDFTRNNAGFAPGLAPTPTAPPEANGPVPFLPGIWEATTPNNAYQIRVRWNAYARRYEGTLVRQGNVSEQVGFSLGELCWIAQPSPDRTTMRVQENWKWGSNRVAARSQWRPGVVRLDRSTSSELTTTLTSFRRVG